MLLVQFSSNEDTRTYLDCKNSDEALESKNFKLTTFIALVRIFENFLMNKAGMMDGQAREGANSMDEDNKPQHIDYQLEELLKFVDQLFDLSALMYNEKANGYTAHGKSWIKGKLHAYLRNFAEQS